MSPEPLTFDWRQIDERLASPMLGKVSEEVRALSHDDEQHIRFQNMGNQNSMTVPSERLKMHLLRSNEWAARTYEVYCEIWQAQSKPLLPAFLRAICKYGIRMLISARISAVSYEFAMEEVRTNSHDTNRLEPVLEGFRRDMERLFAKWEQAAEIDARGLEYLMAGAPRNLAVGLAAREIIETRARTRTLEANIACVEARIEMAERSLSGMLMTETPIYRKHLVEHSLSQLKDDKKEFRSQLDDWQVRLKAALRRGEEIGGASNGTVPQVVSATALNENSESGTLKARKPIRGRHAHSSERIVGKSAHQKAGTQLAYRSILKRAIKAILIRSRKASDLEICRDLDAEGAIIIPKNWVVADNRSFEMAYKNPRLRPRIHTAISKVRADLLRNGII